MSETIQLRQKNPEESENMANLESVDNDVYGYLSRKVAGRLGEYFEVTISDEEGTEVPADGVTGSGSGNYVTFESAGGNIVGFGVSLDVIEDVFGITIERDEDDNVQNAPESVHMQFAPSSEEDYEAADEADEEEADALVAGTDDSDDESADESEEAEELVEISDEELELEA
jgi:hypothetical protein